MTFIYVFFYNFHKLFKIGCSISLCFIIVGCIGFIAGAELCNVVRYIAANVANTAVATIVLTVAVSLHDLVR